MRITVVVCTWNRARLLERTLEAMTRLEIPAGVEWDLTIVNNNCTDDTDGVVQGFMGRLPVRILHEGKAGKSHALNCAVREGAGDYFLFTDDDVLVEPNWIAAYAEAFRRWPDAAIFGGPILPWWDGTPPEWLARTFHLIEYAFAALDLGNEPRMFGGHDVPFGANMAMRSEEQRQNPYDPTLGPRPGTAIRGEEVTLVKRMLEQGAQGWWVPAARVRHFIPSHRQRLAYVREWYRGWGEYLNQVSPGQNETLVLGRPKWLWREVVQAELRFQYRRVTSSPEVWMEDLKRASVAWGRFASPSGTLPASTSRR